MINAIVIAWNRRHTFTKVCHEDCLSKRGLDCTSIPRKCIIGDIEHYEQLNNIVFVPYFM